jgi:hypothetical protein
MSRKICIKCEKRKNRKSFPRHIRNKDGLDSRCKSCVKKEAKIRQKLHKKSPPKPDSCVICKRTPDNFITPNKWHLDHDPDLKYIRGWLCENCNMASGKMGDNMQTACNWMAYMFNARVEYLDNKLKPSCKEFRERYN